MRGEEVAEVMRFHTCKECEEWLSGKNRRKPDEVAGLYTERVKYPSEPHQLLGMARWMARAMADRRPALVWITEWGVWPGGENWHLYYALRQAQQDHRLLYEAPGHFFLEYEAEVMASFLQVAMLNGWGGYVLTELAEGQAVFSHDDFVDFYAVSEVDLEVVRKWGT